MNDENKHIAQQASGSTIDEYAEPSYTIRHGIEQKIGAYSRLEYLSRRDRNIDRIRASGPPPGFEKYPFQTLDEQRYKLLLVDLFHKEIQRAIYNINSNDPPEDSLAFHKAAENYALFEITNPHQNTSFDMIKSPGANCNETFYTNQMTTAAYNLHTKPTVRNPQIPSMFHMKILNDPRSSMTLNKRLHLKALNNFFKQAILVNSVLSAAYKHHMNYVLSLNNQPHAQFLTCLAAMDPRLVTYGNMLAEFSTVARRAFAVAKILQRKQAGGQRAILGGAPQKNNTSFVAENQ